MIEAPMESRMDTARAGGRKSGDRLDFQEVHRSYRARILRYLSRLVGPSEAEDLTQEVFLKVSRALKNFRGGSRVSTWIYRIATNTALDALRKPSFHIPTAALRSETPGSAGERGIEEDTESADRTEEGSPTAESSLIQSEMLDCLRRHVDTLPPNYRAVIVLSVLEGMKTREIAAILGISLQTVKIRLHRGRTRLVKELETHCGWYRDRRNRLTWDGKIL
jgi:RNA polymerase sigma-70 factor (ECF subfamily)